MQNIPIAMKKVFIELLASRMIWTCGIRRAAENRFVQSQPESKYYVKYTHTEYFAIKSLLRSAVIDVPHHFHAQFLFILYLQSHYSINT
jgi:O-phosphoseryl-tRNA(Cys) synthetase